MATVLGALPTVRSVRDELARIPQVDLGLVDGLEDYAEAAGEANSRFVVATTPEEDIVALNDEGMTMRETLHSDALALAHRGLIDRSMLSKFEGLVGYKNVGSDLLNWSNLMLGAWPAIQGKTALTLEEVQKAKHLGERLVRTAAGSGTGTRCAGGPACKRCRRNTTRNVRTDAGLGHARHFSLRSRLIIRVTEGNELMYTAPRLRLGIGQLLDGGGAAADVALPALHFVTHGVIVGMTGSGKTGLITVLVEEALRARVPVLMIDVKGDLPNLLLSFPSFAADAFVPWMDDVMGRVRGDADGAELPASAWKRGSAGVSASAA